MLFEVFVSSVKNQWLSKVNRFLIISVFISNMIQLVIIPFENNISLSPLSILIINYYEKTFCNYSFIVIDTLLKNIFAGRNNEMK